MLTPETCRGVNPAPDALPVPSAGKFAGASPHPWNTSDRYAMIPPADDPMTETPKPHIMLDALNLSLGEGMGIATYTKMLGKTLTSAGYPVSVLYGQQAKPRGNPVLFETLFYDFKTRENQRGRLGWSLRLSKVLTLIQSLRRSFSTPFLVPNETVERRAFDYEPPFPHEKWNAFRLFDLALQYYRWTGRFAEVKRVPGVDIMHWTYSLPIRMQGVPNVYTLHDAIPFRLPHAIVQDTYLLFRVYDEIAKNADAVFTVSEYSLNDLVSLFPALRSRIVNTYQAVPEVSEEIVPLAGSEYAHLPLREENYFCFVGTVEPRKNVFQLLESHARADTGHDLVLIGPIVNCTPSEKKKLRRFQSRPDVHTLEYISREALESLLGNAKALVFPSLLEGFGLPLLESLRLGTPVIASANSSLPEVGGDAVTWIDPYSTDSLVSALQRFAKHSKGHLFPLSEAGSQLDRFSREAYQNRLAGAYRSLLEQG